MSFLKKVVDGLPGQIKDLERDYNKDKQLMFKRGINEGKKINEELVEKIKKEKEKYIKKYKEINPTEINEKSIVKSIEYEKGYIILLSNDGNYELISSLRMNNMTKISGGKKIIMGLRSNHISDDIDNINKLIIDNNSGKIIKEKIPMLIAYMVNLNN